MRLRAAPCRVLRLAALLAALALGHGPAAAADDDPLARAIREQREAFLAGDHGGAFARAESLLREAERRDGPESPTVCAARELVVECRLLGQYRPDPGTCALAARALAYRVRTALPDSTNLLRSLQLRGRCLQRNGELEEAMAHQRRVVAIQERAHGAESYDLSVHLNALAGMLGEDGRHAEMRDVLERALRIRLKHRPPEDGSVLLLRNNLAVAYEAAGDYAAALPLFEEVLARYEVLHGPDHGKTAYASNNLANVLAVTGDRDRARALYERALRIREGTVGAPFEIAETLTNLGHLMLEGGETASARAMFERAMGVADRTLRPGSPHRVQALLGRAAAERVIGAFDAARGFARDALAAIGDGEGAASPGAGRAWRSLGESELASGDPSAGAAALERAVGILAPSLGEDHAAVGAARRRLAEAYAQMGDARSFAEALAAERIAREHQRHTFRVLPERQALEMREGTEGGLDLALAWLDATHGGDGSPGSTGAGRDTAMAATWDALIRSRGLVFDEMTSRIHLRHDADPTVAALARGFAAARQRQANLAVRGPRGEEETVYRGRLEDARREADAAEAALARRSAHFRAELTRGRVGLPEVIAALPRGAALIAFVRFEGPGAPPRYAAFVTGGGPGAPAYLPLGPGAEIDSLVAGWRAAAERRRGDAAGAEASYRRIASALRRRVWDPLTARVGQAREVLVVPDGALGLLNFATLPVGTDAYLVERGPIFHHLSAERDLVPAPRANGTPGARLVAVGGVDYDADPDGGAARPVARGGDPGARRPDLAGGCEHLGSRRFEPLAQSLHEVEDARALWAGSGPGRAVRTLTGGHATEAAIRTLAPGAAVLHLATHGFFLPNACRRGNATADTAASEPLERSGLALAGANARLRGPITGDDGILTAAEVAAIELGATDWVVLSGCETGLGAPTEMEGLLGLRRAFQVAGAGTLVTSLWSVEDLSARHWVRGLYEARLKRNRTAAEAAREASRALLETQRRNGRGGHPASWGAFVVYGAR